MEDLVVPVAALAKLGNGCPIAGRKVLRAMIDLEIEHEIPTATTEKPINVRRATEADEQSILELLRIDIAENAKMVNSYDEQRIVSFIRTATRDDWATIGVIDGSEGVVATIFIEPEQYFWTSDWNLAERITFVHPDHRNSTYAMDLLRFAKWMADGMTMRLGYTVYLTASIAASQDAYRKSALFGRFMHFMGGVFVYPKLQAPLADQ